MLLGTATMLPWGNHGEGHGTLKLYAHICFGVFGI